MVVVRIVRNFRSDQSDQKIGVLVLVYSCHVQGVRVHALAPVGHQPQLRPHAPGGVRVRDPPCHTHYVDLCHGGSTEAFRPLVAGQVHEQFGILIFGLLLVQEALELFEVWELVWHPGPQTMAKR